MSRKTFFLQTVTYLCIVIGQMVVSHYQQKIIARQNETILSEVEALDRATLALKRCNGVKPWAVSEPLPTAHAAPTMFH
jgi:hypothetical protein